MDTCKHGNPLGECPADACEREFQQARYEQENDEPLPEPEGY